MGYISDLSSTTDVVLTKRGRELMSNGNFNPTKWALSDDGIDYRMWMEDQIFCGTPYTPPVLGSAAIDGWAMEHMPILEPSPSGKFQLRNKLITKPLGTSTMPVIAMVSMILPDTSNQLYNQLGPYTVESSDMGIFFIPFSTLDYIGSGNPLKMGWTAILKNTEPGTISGWHSTDNIDWDNAILSTPTYLNGKVAASISLGGGASDGVFWFKPKSWGLLPGAPNSKHTNIIFKHNETGHEIIIGPITVKLSTGSGPGGWPPLPPPGGGGPSVFGKGQ